MSGPQTWPCHACGNIGLSDGDDGFYYCLRCGARAEDIIETGVADEDFVDKGGETGHALYLASHSRRRNLATIKAEPLSQPLSDTPNPLFLWSSLTLEAEGTLKTQRQIKTEEYLDDGVGPSGPEDFGYSSAKGVAPGFDDYYNEIRMRYMMGMQLMIQFQCEALVREFNASPLICGLAGTLWLRFVAVTGVFDDDWADQTIQDSEIQTTEELEDLNRRAKHRAEPRNIRRCKIRAPCCNEIYPCRHCHNEATSMRTSPFDRHELVRFDVKQVVCSVCDTEQPVAQVCTNCGVNMGSISAMFANSMMTIPRKVSSIAQTVGTIRKSCIAKPPREHKAG